MSSGNNQNIKQNKRTACFVFSIVYNKKAILQTYKGDSMASVSQKRMLKRAKNRALCNKKSGSQVSDLLDGLSGLRNRPLRNMLRRREEADKQRECYPPRLKNTRDYFDGRRYA